MKYYYQPSGLVGFINWAWILMIGLLALIMQLEVTHFNIWTGLLLCIFIVVSILFIKRRTICIINRNIKLNQFGSAHSINIPIDEIKYLQITKYRFIFSYHNENYDILVSNQFKNEFKKIMREKND